MKQIEHLNNERVCLHFKPGGYRGNALLYGNGTEHVTSSRAGEQMWRKTVDQSDLWMMSPQVEPQQITSSWFYETESS